MLQICHPVKRMINIVMTPWAVVLRREKYNLIIFSDDFECKGEMTSKRHDQGSVNDYVPEHSSLIGNKVAWKFMKNRKCFTCRTIT